MANTIEDFQKFGKAQFETATASSQGVVKALQAIAQETSDFSKKSLENGSAFLEKLLGVKSFESAIQLQSEFAKSAYADFVAESTKLGELYSALAKEAFKPVELAVAKVQAAKD
ncbi:phasin family protein [Methylocella silvestris]|uniref:Phasin n=1 Tax=Methylocella silvestris TaxID=199596 RepID=A0A2J7TEN4_METSI|nr:phasin family protein [Methylocella silvestris]PNG25219.1 Phasin [Methylocella silvestris]